MSDIHPVDEFNEYATTIGGIFSQIPHPERLSELKVEQHPSFRDNTLTEQEREDLLALLIDEEGV